MATQKFAVGDDQFRAIDRKMSELKRQLNQKGGSPINPEFISKSLQRIIDRKDVLFGQDRFPIWTTVKLGIGSKTLHDFSQKINILGKSFLNEDEKNLYESHFFVSKKVIEIELVVLNRDDICSEKELSEMTNKDFRKRISMLGLKFVPAEVGLQLILQCQDWPDVKFLMLATSTAIISPDYRRKTFQVSERGLSLDGADHYLILGLGGSMIFGLSK